MLISLFFLEVAHARGGGLFWGRKAGPGMKQKAVCTLIDIQRFFIDSRLEYPVLEGDDACGGCLGA